MTIQADPWEQLPFDAELANLHLRLDPADDLQQLSHNVHLRAAVDWAESQTHRAIVSRDHVWTLPRFPWGSAPLRLPRGVTTSIESIEFTQGGVTTTWTGPSSSPAGTDYQENLDSTSGAIVRPAVGMSWPSVDHNQLAPIRIKFKAGWVGSCPEGLQVAMLTYAADRLEMATQNDLANGHNSIAEGLLAPYRLY